MRAMSRATTNDRSVAARQWLRDLPDDGAITTMMRVSAVVPDMKSPGKLLIDSICTLRRESKLFYLVCKSYKWISQRVRVPFRPFRPQQRGAPDNANLRSWGLEVGGAPLPRIASERESWVA